MKTRRTRPVVLTSLITLVTAMLGMSVHAAILINLNVQPGSFPATEGATLGSVTVATFTDPGESEVNPYDITNYTAVIDWGDASPPDSAVLAANGSGGFDVLGTHTYTEHGNYPLTVSVSDLFHGSSGSTNFNVTVADAALTAYGVDANVMEGLPFTVTIAKFTDANPYGTTNDFVAMIHWDDEDVMPGIVVTNESEGGFMVIGTHMYPDERSYAVNVGIVDQGSQFTSAASTVTVGDAPLTPGSMTFYPIEGAPFDTVVATFSDLNPFATAEDFSATIDWGDGSALSNGVVIITNGSFAVTGSHTYTDENSYGVNIEITDMGGERATIGSTAIVADAPLASIGRMITPIENASFVAVVASFTDENPFATLDDFSASVNWGDGVTSSETVIDNGGGTYAVLGSHTYTNQGLYPIVVTIKDHGGSTTTANSQANTSDAPLVGVGKNIAVVQGVTFTNVVADCYDSDISPEPQTDYHCIINWGDGSTSTGIMSEWEGESYTISGSHTYAQTGSYNILVTIDNTQTLVSTTARSTAVVSAPPAEDVTPQFVIHTSTPHFHRRTGKVRQIITIRNVSRQTVGGPVSLVLDNLSSGGGPYNLTSGGDAVTLDNKDGEIVSPGAAPLGSPYKHVPLPKNNVFKGRTARTVVLFFNSSSADITYNARVLAGSGAR